MAGLAKLVMSLVALHKGEWHGKRLLDNEQVAMINAYFEDSEDSGEPKNLPENANRIFQGSIFLGDGFLLTHAEADQLIEADPRNQEVIFPVIDGAEVNNQPDQTPQRKAINFLYWSVKRAQNYDAPYERVLSLVKPVGDKDNMKSRREKWWQFGALASGLYTNIDSIPRCFIAARTTKHLNFSASPTHYVLTDALYVFTTDRYDLYVVVQSTLHEVWARKYSGALKQDLRYSPSKCFDTFPFPSGLWQTVNPELAQLGETYHEHRRAVMLQLWLGLTSIYNLFHSRDLSPEQITKVNKKFPREAETGYQGILQLRRLHVALDTAIRDAYGWHDLDLGHDSIEVETLLENDRIRYTISPAARKEVLKRLLAENHCRAAEQVATPIKAKPKRGKKANTNENQGDICELFGMTARVVSYSNTEKKTAGTLNIEVLLSTTQPLPLEVLPL